MIKINVYKDGGTWFGARWIDGAYDGCDELGIEPEASTAEAIAHAGLMPLHPDGERQIEYVQSEAAS